MKRPVRKLIAFLSAAAMLCDLPLLPAGAAFAAEQIGSDYDAMIRMQNQDVYIENGTAETVGGTQLVVIGSDGEKQLVDLADNVSALYPLASAGLQEYNFLSPTPAAYSFDFFDPSFQLGGDQSVMITKTDDGYALYDLEKGIISKSYPSLKYMGGGFYTTKTFSKYVEGELDEYGYIPTETPESPVGVIKADGTEVFAPDTDVSNIVLTADGKNFVVTTADGAYFTDLTGKQVSDTYKSIKSPVRTEWGYEIETGETCLDMTVYCLTDANGNRSLSFGSFEPETESYSYVEIYSNRRYNPLDPESIHYYFDCTDGETYTVTYYDLNGNKLDVRPEAAGYTQSDDEQPAEEENPAKFGTVEFDYNWDTRELTDANGNVLFTLPEAYSRIKGYRIDDTVYYAAQAENYFTVYDSSFAIVQEHIDGYVYQNASDGLVLWFSDQSDGWGWRDYDAEPAHYGMYNPQTGYVSEMVYSKPTYIPENERFFAEHDKAVVIISLEGEEIRSFSDNYGFATVTHSAYEPFIINGTDAETGKPTSVIYDAIADTVKYEQTGIYDKVEQTKDDAIVVTNYAEENAELWTNDAVYCQGLIHYDGSEVIPPTNDMYVILENGHESITGGAYSFALDTSFYCGTGETKLYAVLRNHPTQYGQNVGWRLSANEGIYVEVDALDAQYRADNSLDAAAKLSDGNYAIVQNGKWGLADSTGAVITEPTYDAIYEYQDGIGLAVTYSNEDVPTYGYNDETNGWGTFIKNRPMPHVGVIDSLGNVQVEPFYDVTLEVGSAWHRTCGVKCRTNDTIYTRQIIPDSYCRVKYTNISSQEVFDPVAVKYGYDSAAKYGDFYVVTKDGLMGIVTEDNTEILPVAYADVLHFTADEYSLASIGTLFGKTLSGTEYTSPFRALADGSFLVSVKTTDGKIQAYRITESGSEDAGVPGDLSGEGTVDASDAAELLIAAARIGAGADSGLTAEQMKAADVNGDGEVNAADAAEILQYAAAVGAGDKRTSQEYFAK